MSFFKDFKEDLSQAVNELLPEDEELTSDFEDNDMVNTLGDEVDVSAELDKLDGLLESVKNVPNVEQDEEIKEAEEKEPKLEINDFEDTFEEKVEEAVTLEDIRPIFNEEKTIEKDTNYEEEVLIVNTIEGMDMQEKKETEVAMDVFAASKQESEPEQNLPEASDEVAIITGGTKIKGDIESDGSVEIQGKITGNISCNGKITVTGEIIGDSKSAEFFADRAKVEGEVVSVGTVKIGMGSVIIGNISATSAVIAGAIKGDIDVQGPVVVDTSAVVMGNIKSRSVQINNGAVIEGFCSQCYAEIDVKSIFGEKKEAGEKKA